MIGVATHICQGICNILWVISNFILFLFATRKFIMSHLRGTPQRMEEGTPVDQSNETFHEIDAPVEPCRVGILLRVDPVDGSLPVSFDKF